MGDIRVQVNDWRTATTLGNAVHLGKSFAFLGPQTFETPGLSWIPRLFGHNGVMPARVLSLLGTEPVDLFGVTLQPASVPALQLRSVTCDKALYREGRDVVRLLILDLLAPGAECTVELDLNGKELGRYPVSLDGRGAALFELRDLPAGDYRARVRGAGGEDCTFSVAVYRLAPLVASLIQRRMETPSRIWVRLRVEAYGVPVEGPVQIELSDRGNRGPSERAEVRAGFVEVTLPISGEGPHALNIQLLNDPSRTATIPLVGSRAFEREQTLFSTLGTEVLGALLPGETTRPIRGVYLEDGVHRASPFTLERIDTATARLRATTHIDHACVVLLDPTFPQRRSDAIDPTTAPHPANEDQAYVRGEKLFHQGKFIEARALFELGLSSRPVAHPNYAYYVACCHARMGDLAQAVASLRMAIEHGWSDWRHLQGDEDLAALRGYRPFEALQSGGYRELSVTSVVPGQVIELEGFDPLSLVVLGAFADGTPWEGWAVLLAPETIEARIVAPEIPVPGSEVRIDVEVGDASKDASVFLLVKDARLLSPDTPLNRLAGRIKTCAHSMGKELGAGPVMRQLSSLISPPPLAHAPPPMHGAPLPPPGFGVPSGIPMPPSPSAAIGGFGSPPMPAARPAMAARPAPPMPASPMPMPAAPRASAPASRGAPLAAEAAPQGAPGRSTEENPSSPPAIVSTEEPEILFAGLVEAHGGQASISVVLGPTATDYIVEAFVLTGLQWSMSETRFRAEKTPSVALELPPFVHPGDTALGRVVARCASSRMRVRVLRDGVPLPLIHEGRPLSPGEELGGNHAELSFLVQPGAHEAILEELDTGAADWVHYQVNAPGSFRRLTRTVRFLNPGEEASRTQDPALLGLGVMPGLDRPFTTLIDATADYGHACCEQTAAKMMAASGMYVFAGSDQVRRSRAEAILLSGIRRMRSMWLRSRGFKMYPESSNEPNDYWGRQAAMHLWFLAAVREAAVAPSKALLQGIEEGLAMATDATQAYRIPWPPSESSSCETAYRVVRFGTDPKARERALSLVRQRASSTPTAHGAVARRVEWAYAAAALLRGGQRADLTQALALANSVTQAMGANGRLYSTVDSVAAIALMAELKNAGVLGGGGVIQVNGQRISQAEALQFEGEIQSIQAHQGVVAVEERRLVEESWGGFSQSVPLRISLERNGRPTRRVSIGDSIALRVTLEGGYKMGDLLWVCLPDALSRVLGGGQIKLFSVDFEGKNEVLVPLAATGLTVGPDGEPAPQHFALCVRNMFEEERAGNPGLLDVLVESASGGSNLGRLVRGFKSIFGA